MARFFPYLSGAAIDAVQHRRAGVVRRGVSVLPWTMLLAGCVLVW